MMSDISAYFAKASRCYLAYLMSILLYTDSGKPRPLGRGGGQVIYVRHLACQRLHQRHNPLGVFPSSTGGLDTSVCVASHGVGSAFAVERHCPLALYNSPHGDVWLLPSIHALILLTSTSTSIRSPFQSPPPSSVNADSVVAYVKRPWSGSRAGPWC